MMKGRGKRGEWRVWGKTQRMLLGKVGRSRILSKRVATDWQTAGLSWSLEEGPGVRMQMPVVRFLEGRGVVIH